MVLCTSASFGCVLLVDLIRFAVIGDGRTAALLEPSSRIVWWCLPRYDGDPVFCRLLSGGEDERLHRRRARRAGRGFAGALSQHAIVVTELIDDKGAGAHPRLARFQISGMLAPPQVIRIIEPIGGCRASPSVFAPRIATANRLHCDRQAAITSASNW